ncbi:hypothetical protein AB6A40_008823 [Gnathostoma spinigerum]|uniref:tRNA (guanine(10)-N(2))-methyltransferase TRMT11 n=1 Tax=Gnathostoma spinigerum TaxID=75299 RepID=A0ABD6EXX8_9BILA
MPKYVFIFSQIHLNFRIPEFISVCSLFGIDFDQSLLSTEKHVFVLDFESDDAVMRILSRTVLVKCAFLLFFRAPDYDILSDVLIRNREIFLSYNSPEESFALRIFAVGRKRDLQYQHNIIDKFGSLLPLDDAPVDLTNAKNIFFFIEEFGKTGQVPDLENVYFGRFVGNGQSHLKVDYSLKTRRYIGNTTMDPELSFIQANLIKSRFGSLTLDPFCGTGGLLISAAHFGSSVIGMEINYLVARAKGKSSRSDKEYLSDDDSIAQNFRQYNLLDRYLAVILGDASRHEIWRSDIWFGQELFDAIVADPPYGLREKGRKVGKKERKPSWTLPCQKHEEHYPEKQRYGLASIFIDLMNLASKLLVVNGRLCFWFPVFKSEYSERVLPMHPALRLVANCEQSLSKSYSRRLLLFEKTRRYTEGEEAYIEENCYKNTTFRERVYVGNNTLFIDESDKIRQSDFESR